METKKLSQEQKDLLKKPLPPEAIKQHPTKTYLSTINAIYVVERLNEVFGVGEWKLKADVINSVDKMVTVKCEFTVPEYGIELEQFGGNDNVDKGDALKGAMTDALTKIGSYLGIGADVWKSKGNDQKPQNTVNDNKYATPQPVTKKPDLVKWTNDELKAFSENKNFTLRTGNKNGKAWYMLDADGKTGFIYDNVYEALNQLK